MNIMRELAGVYRYHRVGHDERALELLPDGSIGNGAGVAERSWTLRRIQGTTRLSLFGEHGETCRLAPEPDGAWRGAWRKFERMPVELVPQRRFVQTGDRGDPELGHRVDQALTDRSRAASHRGQIAPSARSPDRTDALGGAGRSDAETDFGRQPMAGRYFYRRVFHDDRPMELLADGTIGEGAAGCERRWARRGLLLEISGQDGVICELKQDLDGVWRGTWNQHGRMPIELYPLGLDVPPMPHGGPPFSFPEGAGFWWMNYESLGKAIRKLCRQLPPLRAVAGIPRSGVIPASLIAQWQNIPLLTIDEALVLEPHLPSYRRRGATDIDQRLPILIVDDTVCSGRAMAWYRSRAHGKGNYLFAAPYVDRDRRHFVDFFAEDHPRCHQAFEWNLLHEATNSDRALCDLDGVICEEWTGGDEERKPAAYLRHLVHAKPLLLPTKQVLGIVTGRMHIYRDQTAAWLQKHGVAYRELWMLPAATEKERSRIGPARFKARIFSESSAALFVESCPVQARQIHELTGKPVIDFTNMIAHGATIVR